MVDPATRAALIALIARWQLAYYEKEQQIAIRDAAKQRAETAVALIEQCKSACKALGFDRDNRETWDQLVLDLEDEIVELYDRSRTLDVPPWVRVRRPTEATKQIELLAPPSSEPSEDRPPIREIALSRLYDAGDKGLKASDIRQYIEKTYASPIHEKTVGMTLYRLLKDELVRREGHTWFIVPPIEAETMNPGGDTPGLEELLK